MVPTSMPRFNNRRKDQTSHPTARQTMTELSILELVNMTEVDEEEKKIKLKPEFGWFLSKEFKKLREEFVPTDNTEEMKKE
jgi:hypothetical protein